MKRTIFAATLALTIACLPTAALLAETVVDARQQKRDAIEELLKVIDAKELTRSMFQLLIDQTMALGEEQQAAQLKTLPPQEQVKFEARRKAADEKRRAIHERFSARIDYAKSAEEIYYPLFDRNFSLEELKTLTAFFKTKEGAKTARLLAELSMGGMYDAAKKMEEARLEIVKESEMEESARRPWSKTMRDMRTVATALQARATYTKNYPDVKTFEELEQLLVPTYLRTFPRTDAWGNAYVYVASADNEHYRIVSGGADNKVDWDNRTYQAIPKNTRPRIMPTLDEDIIFQDGNFVQMPKEAVVGRGF